MRYLLLILALMIPQMAAARMYDTEENCEKRYGKATKGKRLGGKLDVIVYDKPGYEIWCHFVNGKCGMFLVSKEGLTAGGAEAIAKKNMKINDVTSMIGDKNRVWYSAGKKIEAFYNAEDGSLMMWDTKYWGVGLTRVDRIIDQENKKKAQEEAAGF